MVFTCVYRLPQLSIFPGGFLFHQFWEGCRHGKCQGRWRYSFTVFVGRSPVFEHNIDWPGLKMGYIPNLTCETLFPLFKSLFSIFSRYWCKSSIFGQPTIWTKHEQPGFKCRWLYYPYMRHSTSGLSIFLGTWNTSNSWVTYCQFIFSHRPMPLLKTF